VTSRTFSLARLAYYFLLDVPLALATAVATGALFYAAKLAAGTGIASGWTWSGVFFVGGWISSSSAMCSKAASPRSRTTVPDIHRARLPCGRLFSPSA